VQNSIGTRIFKSKDNISYTNGFKDITPVSGVLTNTLHGRIELAISPSNNNVI